MTALAVRLGSGIVKAVPTALFIGSERVELESCTRNVSAISRFGSPYGLLSL
jgi:hypothetical protein